MNTKKRFMLKIQQYRPWFIAAITVLSANIAANAIYDSINLLVNRERVVISFFRILCILFFIIMAILIYRQRNALFRPHTRYLKSKAEKRKHLILFLSNLDQKLVPSGGIPDKLQLTSDLIADIRRIDDLKRRKEMPFWNWEMSLRGIKYHVETKKKNEKPKLQTITLICSQISIIQAHLFLNICKGYDQLKNLGYYLLVQENGEAKLIPSSMDSIDSSYGWNFENFDDLSGAFWELLNEFKRKGYPEKEIMIDITGGQKPNSVVGASMTFNRKIKSQYVQTNDPWEIISYDLIYPPSGKGELEL